MSKCKPSSPCKTCSKCEVFKEIRKYAKDEGCPITVHKNLNKINGSNGYFCASPRPHIKAAVGNKSWAKAFELIIHEFCHYWQWSTNFIGRKDDDANGIYGEILEGIEVTPKKRKRASHLVRISEYDCEIRTAALFDKWNLESLFPPSEHIKSANTYNRHIAWSIGDDKNVGSGIFLPTYDKLANQLWGNKVFKHFWNPKTSQGKAKLLAPISSKHKAIFDAAASKQKSKKTAARRCK